MSRLTSDGAARGRSVVWNALIPTRRISRTAAADRFRRPRSMCGLSMATKWSAGVCGQNKWAVANLAWFATGSARLISNSIQIRAFAVVFVRTTSAFGSYPSWSARSAGNSLVSDVQLLC